MKGEIKKVKGRWVYQFSIKDCGKMYFDPEVLRKGIEIINREEDDKLS